MTTTNILPVSICKDIDNCTESLFQASSLLLSLHDSNDFKCENYSCHSDSALISIISDKVKEVNETLENIRLQIKNNTMPSEDKKAA